MISFASLQSQRERASSAYDNFELDMIQNYPESSGNIPWYILIQLSNCKEWSKNHLKWSMLYDRWADCFFNKSKSDSAVLNHNYRAIASLNL